MSFVLQIIADLIGSLVGGAVVSRAQAHRDRRRLVDSRVRSGLRAVEGRVLNIGTEWSEGISEISPGHLRFIPRMGIIGNREMEVIGLAYDGSTPRLLQGLVALRLTTPSGELYWAVPDKLVDDIAELVRP